MSISVEQVDLPAARTLVVRGHAAFSDITEFLGRAFAETAAAAAGQGLGLVGPPFGRYRPAEDGWDVEAGFPVAGSPAPAGQVEVGSLPAGAAVKVLHQGPYDDVESTYRALEEWIAGHGFVANGQAWESYLDEPNAPRPRTEIIQPCTPPEDMSQAGSRAAHGA